MFNSHIGSQSRVALAAALITFFSCGAMASSPHESVIGNMPPQGTGGLVTPVSIIYRDHRIYGVTRGTYVYGDPPPADPYMEDGIFSMSLSGEVTKVHEFDGSDGTAPGGSNLVLLQDGSLLGATYNGAYAISPSGDFSWLTADRSSFAGPDGSDLVVGSDGKVYGIDSGDYGYRLVSLDSGGVSTVVYDFGADQAANLVAGPSGELYLTLPNDDAGGQFPSDVVFRIKDGVGTAVHVLQPDGSEGHTITDLAVDAAGNLIGSTQGDAYTQSTLFKVTPDGTFSVIHRFSEPARDGSRPGQLFASADGNIYGATRTNGPAGLGTTFRVAPNGTYTVLLDHSRWGWTQGPGRSLLFDSLSGANGTGAIGKLVVPIQDDIAGTGKSSLIGTAAGLLWTASVGGTRSFVPVSAGYHVVASGDFDGDGIADILWTSAKHDLYIWLGGTGGFTAKYAGTYPAGWKVVGAGDFDGDGMDDLAWTNASTSQFSYWLMKGAVRKGYKVIKYTAGYYPVTVGDYDGDGRADVLWSSSRHDLYAWVSHGQGFVSHFVARFPAAWKISGRGDLDADGKADLVWSTTDGMQWGYWLMDGGSIRSTRSFAVPAAVSGSRVAAVADYDGDGAADLLWSDGHAATLWENQGGCQDEPGCAFSQAVPAPAMSAGLAVYNSGVPASY